MSDAGQPLDESPDEGWVDHTLSAEFPELALLSTTVAAREGRSPPGLRERLRTLSDRWYGARAISIRNEPVPHAYRVFFRQVGLDPDATRTPMEEAVLARLMAGGFRSHSRVADATLVALVETGVPVWALDEERLDGPLGLRPARAGERLGRGELAPDLPDGRLVVADAAEPVAVLFAEPSPQHVVTSATTTARLYTIRVAGVPEIHVEEALWLCAEALASG